MMTLHENPVDQRFLEWCCCSVAAGLAAARKHTEYGSAKFTRPMQHTENGPSKFSSCRIPNQPLKLKPLRIKSHEFNRGSISHLSKTSSSLDICAAAFNSTCVKLETDPLARYRKQTATRTLAPFKGKSKFPSVDDGGNRLPPRGRRRKYYGGDDGGDGMPPRGGGNWWGQFFFALFQASLALLRDRKEKKRTGEDED